ncbi:hypothetical protein PG989_010468 [Apiospora arundinis]
MLSPLVHPSLPRHSHLRRRSHRPHPFYFQNIHHFFFTPLPNGVVNNKLRGTLIIHNSRHRSSTSDRKGPTGI